jgi:predicted RNase H-like HicB family nuclease
MYFPAAVFIEQGKAYGVTLPDIPGCNTAGDTQEEALANVQEAVELMLDDAAEKPAPSSLERYKDDPAYQDARWELVDVNFAFMNVRIVQTLEDRPARHDDDVDK